MAIELWWWVVPLALTGWITFVFFGLAVIIVDKVCNSYWATAILAAIATAPWVVCVLSVIVWLVANAMVAIWGV